MANKQCVTRLQKEYRTLLKEPVPHITAHPSPSNLLEWHYVLEGAKGSEFEGGVYHGKIVFPPQYPFKPPSISMFTPNGRFATNTKLCLSMTDYHPESWNPMWSVGTILNGLLSFMYDSQPTTGSITTNRPEKERLARESLTFNIKNPLFKKLFPEWCEEHERRQGGAAGTTGTDANDNAAGGGGGGGEGGNGTVADGGAGGKQGVGAQAGVGQGGGLLGAGGGRRGGEAGAQGQQPQPQGGSSFMTVAIVVVVLAAVVVPLFKQQGVMDGLLGARGTGGHSSL